MKAKLPAEEKRRKLLNFTYSEDAHYREHTTVELVNGRYKPVSSLDDNYPSLSRAASPSPSSAL